MKGFLKLAWVVLALSMAAGSGCKSAPSAEKIDGPIVDEIEEGIASGQGGFEHATFDALVSTHADASTGTVDYAGLAEEEARLDRYLESLAGARLEELSRRAQLALFINAYNACTLKLILRHYPGLESIRDIDSPWTKPRCEVGGHRLSLDEIEHNIIRPIYRDPRIHFAVNCAATSCPHLAEFAYTGAEIDAQLEARTRATLSDEKFVRIEQGSLGYTRVMEWYRDDFVDPAFAGSAGSVPRYIAEYTRKQVRAFIEDHGGEPPSSPLEYDWSLNDAP